MPPLPPAQPPRPPLCAMLDCCTLWLRHNLHKKLEVYCYMYVGTPSRRIVYSSDTRTCVRTCYRVIWYLQREHVRLGTYTQSHRCYPRLILLIAVYHWQGLWKAFVLLLDFLASKLDSLVTTGGVEQLAQEVCIHFDRRVRQETHKSLQTILSVDLALCRNEQLLPTPKDIHELVVRCMI